MSEGPAFNSSIADAWSNAGVWTFVADTFAVTGAANINSLQLSLIPDDGNQMSAAPFAAFDQVQIQLLPGASTDDATDGPTALFPNPTTNKLWVEIPYAPHSMQLSAAEGRCVRVPQFVQGARRPELDVEALCPGPYLLRIATGTDLSTLRFVKQ